MVNRKIYIRWSLNQVTQLRYTTVFKLSEQSAFDFFKQGWVYFNANENVYENLRIVWKMKK